MHPFNKLMQKKKMEGKMMSPIEQKAKMNVVKEMRKMASDEMSEPLKLKKISVASNDKDGLKVGLDKAKQIIEGKELAHGGMAEEAPEMEELEEDMGADLDHDNEEGEPMEHQEAVLGEEPGSEDMSPEEIDERIMELMKMKEQMKSGGMPR